MLEPASKTVVKVGAVALTHLPPASSSAITLPLPNLWVTKQIAVAAAIPEAKCLSREQSHPSLSPYLARFRFQSALPESLSRRPWIGAMTHHPCLTTCFIQKISREEAWGIQEDYLGRAPARLLAGL